LRNITFVSVVPSKSRETMSTQANLAHSNSQKLSGKSKLLACTLAGVLFVLFASPPAEAEDSGRGSTEPILVLFGPPAGTLQPAATAPAKTGLGRAPHDAFFMPIGHNPAPDPDLRTILKKELITNGFASQNHRRVTTATLLSTLVPDLSLAPAEQWDARHPYRQQDSWVIGFWSVQAAMWGSVILDGWVSGKAAPGPGCSEGNPRFRDADGGFRRGKYFAMNTPIITAITVSGHWLSDKSRHSPYPSVLRLLAIGPASAVTAGHMQAAMGWINHCR